MLIAKLAFEETRSGHGTALLEFIQAHSGIFGIEHVGLEYACTKAAKGFARYHDFVETRNDVISPHERALVSGRNWVKPTLSSLHLTKLS